MVRFECLRRSRMAKHAVLSRLLLRKISDGRWVGLDEFKDITARNKAISLIANYRKQLDCSKGSYERTSLNALCDKLRVGYDYRQKIHFIEFKQIS